MTAPAGHLLWSSLQRSKRAGSSNAEIATRLYMSLATVKAHVSRLLVKLGAANRVQIALLVQEAAAGRPR